MPPLAGIRPFLESFPPFLGDFVADALPRLLVLVVPPLLLLVLILIVFDVLGRGMGLSKLFWHRKRRLQLEHGVLCALVVGHVSYVSFLLDYDVWLTKSIVAETEEDPEHPYSGLSWLQGKLLEYTDALRIDDGQGAAKSPPPFTWAARETRPWVAGERQDGASRFAAWDDSLAFFYYHLGMLACIALVIGAAVLVQALLSGVGTTRPEPVRGFAYGESRVWLPVGFVAGTAGLLVVSRLWGGASDWIVEHSNGLFARTTHLSAAVVAAVVGGILLLLRAPFVRRSGRFRASPATSICLCLSFTAAVFGFFVYNVRLVDVPSFGLLAFAALAGLLVLSAWRNPYRYRLSFLAERYRTPVDLDDGPARTKDVRPPLTFAHLAGRESGRPSDLFVVVCASGGGITAAAWAVETLTRLEARLAQRGIDLARCARLVCGASGGMLGAAHWATARDEDGPTSTAVELCDSIASDTLSDVTRHLVTYDLPQLFVPFAHGEDRGTVQERSWLRCFGGHLALTLDDLVAGERAGWRPPLAFTPTLLEQGRRLVISNVDLDDVTRNRLPRGCGDDSGLDASGVELRTWFPAEAGMIPIVSAARASATFPFVSPAASLPTCPALRLGDAGYYDNWGVSLASSWLRHHVEELPAGARVVLIELDAYPKSARQARAVRLRRGGDEPPRSRTSALVGVLARTLEDLQAPLIGALSARAAASRLRNDELLEGLAGSMAKRGLRFTYVPLVNTFPASLSWILTDAEVDELRREAEIAVREALELLDHAQAPAQGPR